MVVSRAVVIPEWCFCVCVPGYQIEMVQPKDKGTVKGRGTTCKCSQLYRVCFSRNLV